MSLTSNLNKPLFHKLILIIAAFVFYANTLQNDYALDDILVITNNKFVKKGISGISDILTHDSYYGASGKIAKASGGRYRPLSLVFFAIEKDFFGVKPAVFHFFNIFYYSILCLMIYFFLLKHVFKDKPGFAFSAAFLFLIHPVHTEVVANIKSRDEILSLFFVITTLHFLITHLQSKKITHLIFSIFAFVLALLSKEQGVVFIIMIPLSVYVFSDKKISEIIKTSTPFWFVISAYLFLRFSANRIAIVEEKDLMNSPYLLADTVEKFATILWVLLEYIKLMFVPSPLSYDYSYNQVPYVTFSNLQTILSVLVYSALTIFSITYIVRKNKAAYFILFYLLTLFIVSNILINIGTPLAERFLFVPGLFLIISILILIQQNYNRLKTPYVKFAPAILIIIAGLSFYKVYSRNTDWKNNETLYFKDAITSSNSARANAFCGMNMVPNSDTIPDSLEKSKFLINAIQYFRNAYNIYPDFASMYQNWGGAYHRLGMIDSAAWAWNRLKTLNPSSKFIEANDDMLNKSYYTIYHKKFLKSREENNLDSMFIYYREAVRHYDKMPDSWVLLGQLYQLKNKPDSAQYAWKKCLELQPDNKQAIEFLNQH